jgi:hypothetical protein
MDMMGRGVTSLEGCEGWTGRWARRLESDVLIASQADFSALTAKRRVLRENRSAVSSWNSS